MAASPVQLDPASRRAVAGERSAVLNRREYAVLAMLCEARGGVVSHATLLAGAWGPHTTVPNLRVAIRHLRRKLEPDPDLPCLIVAVPGQGYRLGPTAQANAAALVPLARLERALLAELDFESSASTDSTTGAGAGGVPLDGRGGSIKPRP